MTRKVKIDKGIYEINDETKTYKFHKRNHDWERLDDDENEKNKKSIDGYTRIFRDGREKMFIRSEHP
ncbi:MAG: hypothetical protein D4R64_01960 [Porphyromonadaceae bacterium]|nr:MAG: hypothetical protein D4R64_01960 [Porphyromonadaceae bacterium]